MLKTDITSDQKAKLVLEALEEKKAVDPIVLNVRGRTVMTDYFIIASGASRVHIQALVDAVVEKLKNHGIKSKRLEGYDEATWVLLDYADVVVHVMSQDQRDFYRLEAYWSGAEKGSPPVLETE